MWGWSVTLEALAQSPDDAVCCCLLEQEGMLLTLFQSAPLYYIGECEATTSGCVSLSKKLYSHCSSLPNCIMDTCGERSVQANVISLTNMDAHDIESSTISDCLCENRP